MKKFVKKVILFASFCLLLMVGISVTIDPYNVFHINTIRDNGIEPNKNYVKMSYILSTGTKYDAFLFGSSRVGSIHTDKIEDVTCYNMTYSEGIPSEHLDNIKTLISSGYEIKRIYIGLDALSYTLDPQVHQVEHLRCPYEYIKSHPLHFCKLYLDSSLALESLKISKTHIPDENFAKNFYSYGWWCEYKTNQTLIPEKAYALVGTLDLLDETLHTIEDIITLCNDYNIELVVFTNPVYYLSYDSFLDSNYLEFIERLSSITNFYNFSGINDISLNEDNFTDSSHYDAEVGDLMIEYMCNGKKDGPLYEQGFGVYVTPENVDYVLTLLEIKSGLTY